MKRVWKAVIAGVVIAIGGVVVLLCALGAAGWNYQSVTEWEEDAYVATNDVTKLNVKVNAGKVVIKRGDTDTVSIKYQHNDVYKTEISQSTNGTLNVEAGKKEWYNITFWYKFTPPTTEIEVGQNCNPTIDLTLNAGTVNIGDSDWGERIDVTINAGTVTFGELTVDKLTVKINAGKMSANKIDCQQVTCELNAGGFEVKEIACDTFDCDISAGSVDVKKLDSRSIKVDVSAGAANLNVAGSKSDYNIKVDKSAGSCNVSNQTGADSTKHIDVDVSAGSVTITFDN